MNIVIIEDEEIVAEDLEISLTKLVEEPVTFTHLRSVKAATAYFLKSHAADLIFSDIQLGDGLSFAAFVAAPVTTPVIFCTAYDEYALDAFKANGIDYILKPFTLETLNNSLNRYRQLKEVFSTTTVPQFDTIMQLLAQRESNKTASVLVYHSDKIIPIPLEDIALFCLANEVIHLMTFSGKTYYPNKTLDELEKLAGNSFFRANRQCLVCRKAIIDVSSFFSRKLSVNVKVAVDSKIIVSKEKAPQFLAWLSRN